MLVNHAPVSLQVGGYFWCSVDDSLHCEGAAHHLCDTLRQRGDESEERERQANANTAKVMLPMNTSVPMVLVLMMSVVAIVAVAVLPMTMVMTMSAVVVAVMVPMPRIFCLVLRSLFDAFTLLPKLRRLQRRLRLLRL